MDIKNLFVAGGVVMWPLLNNGEIFLNKKAISVEQLEIGIREKLEPQKQLMVLLNADEKVNHGQVVAVMDKVRRVEGVKLGIATRK